MSGHSEGAYKNMARASRVITRDWTWMGSTDKEREENVKNFKSPGYYGGPNGDSETFKNNEINRLKSELASIKHNNGVGPAIPIMIGIAVILFIGCLIGIFK